MTCGSLFSGIGGLDLGLERAGFEVRWQVEIDPFCRRVLAKHWPDTPRFCDVRNVADLERVDLIAGGFPCQPSSVAGRRLGTQDPRWLWPQFARLISQLRPTWVVVENVPGLRTTGLREVLADLADLGFDAEWDSFGAFEFGAPHVRSRLFLVASDPRRVELREQPGWLERSCRPCPLLTRHALEEVASAYPDGERRLESARRFAEIRGWSELCGWDGDPLAGVDDGLPEELDRGARRKALGNAVVPQVAEVIGRAILAADRAA